MESKVGRMGSGFYTLMFNEDTNRPKRLAYLWQRRLFQDIPNTPHRLCLELYEGWNKELWALLFGDLKATEDKIERLREYVADDDIRLCRLDRSPSGVVGLLVYDGEKLTIDSPMRPSLISIDGMGWPKTLYWSNLTVREHIRGNYHAAAS